MAFGDRIRQRREEKGLSAAELARQAGISKAYLSELENGRTARPSGEILHRLAISLGTTIADLLEREVNVPSSFISPSLQRFIDTAKIPQEDVQMLSQIRFRGDQPVTPEDWQYLYESIKRSIVRRPDA